jgi:peptide deformylase
MSMAVLTILEAPNPLLKLRAAPVTAGDAGLRKLADDMLETMYKAPGIGLAAPQVGVSKRLCVVDIADRKNGEEPQPLVLLNPAVVWTSTDEAVIEEGCLSLPGQFAEVSRPTAVRVRYQDLAGEEREIEGDGLLARCLQHEIDHLDGILFVDHLSPLKRGIILRKLAKARRSRA